MRSLGVPTVVLMLGLPMLPLGSPSTAQCPVQPDLAPETSVAFVPGQPLVRFRPAVTQQQVERLLEVNGVRHVRRIETLDTEVLQLPPWLSVPEAMERPLQYREVDYAEPNYILLAASTMRPMLPMPHPMMQARPRAR